MSETKPQAEVAPEPQYRLTITGNAAAMRQISQAFELQARVHLGQIDEVFGELEEGIHAAAKAQGMPIGSVAEGHTLVTEGQSGSQVCERGHAASAARFEALMAFRDAIKPVLHKAEEVWRTFTRRAPLEALHAHGNLRERVGYGFGSTWSTGGCTSRWTASPPMIGRG